MSSVEAPNTAEAADFVRRFEAAWAAPTPEGLTALIAPDGRLVQPLYPTHGRDGMGEFVRRLRAMLPGLHGGVRRWGPTEDGVVIELELISEPARWTVCDRIVLDEEGLVRERVSYFDPLVVLRQVALRPRTWPLLLRSLRLRR
jgi:hypothetical protein